MFEGVKGSTSMYQHCWHHLCVFKKLRVTESEQQHHFTASHFTSLNFTSSQHRTHLTSHLSIHAFLTSSLLDSPPFAHSLNLASAQPHTRSTSNPSNLQNPHSLNLTSSQPFTPQTHIFSTSHLSTPHLLNVASLNSASSQPHTHSTSLSLDYASSRPHIT